MAMTSDLAMAQAMNNVRIGMGSNPGGILGIGGSGGALGIDTAHVPSTAHVVPSTASGPNYRLTLRFVDDKVIVMINNSAAPYQFSEYIGDSIEDAMDKIKAHMVKERVLNSKKSESGDTQKAP
jgi:hypothetical protein